MIYLRTAFTAVLLFLTLNASSVFSRGDAWRNIAGSAYLDQRGYEMLRKICDRAGGRLPGSASSAKAISIIETELQSLGIKYKLDKFEMPCWERGDDIVEMLEPSKKKIRAVALGYVNALEPFSAFALNAGNGLEEDFGNADFTGKIAVIHETAKPGKQKPLRYEMIETAAKRGARAVLLVAEKQGGLTMGGVSNFQGSPSPIPAFSIAFEDGTQILRLLEEKIDVSINITVKSKCYQCKGANIIATLKGRSEKKVVIGAHYDSWDMGQGAVDNGYGTAILLDVARLAAKYSSDNYFTLEFVWFDAEELGLHGSKHYAETYGANVAAMLNMDMTGSPTGINNMGFEAFSDIFREIIEGLNGFDLKEGVVCHPWVNSDHTYFMLKGIPSFVMQAKLEKDMYWHYHDYGDTFDKVDKRFLADAAAIVAIFAVELANHSNMPPHLTESETIELHKKYKLDERLKRQKQWHFEE